MAEFISKIDGRSAESLIRKALAKTGPLKNLKSVDAKTIAYWTGHVPDALIDVWANFGIGTLNGGRLRLCLPEEFEQVTRLLFNADSDFSDDTHAVAVSAFGDIFFWSARHWLCHFSITKMAFFTPLLFNPELKTDPNQLFIDWILSSDPMMSELIDLDGKPMYDLIKKELGPLPSGAFYGIMPEPGDLANFKVESIRIVPTLDYLKLVLDTMIFQMTDPRSNKTGRRVGPSKW